MCGTHASNFHLLHLLWAESCCRELVLVEHLGVRILCHLDYGVDEAKSSCLQWQHRIDRKTLDPLCKQIHPPCNGRPLGEQTGKWPDCSGKENIICY